MLLTNRRRWRRDKSIGTLLEGTNSERRLLQSESSHPDQMNLQSRLDLEQFACSMWGLCFIVGGSI